MNDFTKKSIGTLTLGEKLKKIRSERRLSLVEAAKGTRIQMRYLEDLENGNYGDLPVDVYVKGFLRNYAQFLGINENSLIKLYEKEKKIQSNLNKDKTEEKNYVKPLNFARPIITPKFLLVGAVATCVFLTFFYLYRELNVFISTPQLVITEPLDRSMVENKTVRVNGMTEKDAKLFINNQPVLVNQEGEFSEEVNLQSGTNTITVKAINRFNEETTKTVSIDSTYKEENFQEFVSGAEDKKDDLGNAKLLVDISTEKESSWISVESDGNLVFSGTMEKENVQQFQANEKISISAEKGNAVFVQIKGQEKKLLSDKKGMVKDITFLAESK